MRLGRCGLTCGIFAAAALFIFNGAAKSWAQQTAAAAASSAEPESPIGPSKGLPAPEPVAQAAIQSSTGKIPAPNPPLTDEPLSTALRLGPGDLLEIGVYNVPELSTKARVSASGDVYLPLIDYVHVSDLTVEEAQQTIQKRLENGGFIRGAHVTVLLDESASQGVTILGEVAKPGIYPLIGDRKLYDFISAAGGFSPTAGRKITIIRQRSQTPISLNLPRNILEDLQDDVEIFPGDTISIPRAPIVYVVGDVGRPSGLLVDNGSLTVLQALALAGGTNHTAKMGSVRIIRKGPTGMTETKVPLKKMLEAKAPDMTLEADDILFVPLSGVREAAAQATSAAISAGTGLAVIAVHP